MESPTASVECAECNLLLGEVSALSRHELCALVTSLVAACHATQPHCNHPLRVSLPEIRGDTRELRIRCLHWNCRDVPSLVATCAIELVGALTLVFHTSHEGHPIELSYAGQTWASPTSLQNPPSKMIGPDP